MRRFLRSPLMWMVVVELAVVGALIAVAWTVIASASRPALVSPAVALPDSAEDAPSPPPELPVVIPGGRGPLPGLNLGSSFWRERLARLNREQAVLVELEWRLVHSAMDAVRHYFETVVLPAVWRAEHAGGAP